VVAPVGLVAVLRMKARVRVALVVLRIREAVFRMKARVRVAQGVLRMKLRVPEVAVALPMKTRIRVVGTLTATVPNTV
jgi:hypothetical protein